MTYHLRDDSLKRIFRLVYHTDSDSLQNLGTTVADISFVSNYFYLLFFPHNNQLSPAVFCHVLTQRLEVRAVAASLQDLGGQKLNLREAKQPPSPVGIWSPRPTHSLQNLQLLQGMMVRAGNLQGHPS